MTSATPVLGREGKLSIAGMSGVILVLHVLGWGSLLFFVAPQHFSLAGSGAFGVGLGVTAYLLGMRHAFDADHIAAIDNTTRKLMAERKPPVSVGFWFSLGHSTVVFGLCVLLSFGVRALVGPVENGGSALQDVAAVVGTVVSGIFLLLIGVLNLVALRRLVGVFRRMRSGQYDEDELERRLDERGFMNRLLRPIAGSVRKPWHMYPIGLLFGLGFDTATEISLLVLAGGAAAFSLPWYAILTLPVLFTAGMSLLDSIDGCFMNFAYGWAFAKPVRKVYYNMTVTALSVAVALVIGVIELLGLLAEKLDVSSGPLAWIAGLDMDYVGFIIVGLFLLAWLLALAVWRLARVEQRWTAEPEVSRTR